VDVAGTAAALLWALLAAAGPGGLPDRCGAWAGHRTNSHAFCEYGNKTSALLYISCTAFFYLVL
jgi:hypothetical protein